MGHEHSAASRGSRRGCGNTTHEVIPFGKAIGQRWGALKACYVVAKYEQIPPSKYDDCVTFLNRFYQQGTGEVLNETQPQLPNLDAA